MATIVLLAHRLARILHQDQACSPPVAAIALSSYYSPLSLHHSALLAFAVGGGKSSSNIMDIIRLDDLLHQARSDRHTEAKKLAQVGKIGAHSDTLQLPLSCIQITMSFVAQNFQQMNASGCILYQIASPLR